MGSTTSPSDRTQSTSHPPPGRLIHHPSGHTTHIVIDDFTDPWKPSETVLIQPGFGRHSHHFYHFIPTLAKHYRVIRRDLRGHGYSSYDKPGTQPSTCTIDNVCDEIIDTLDQLGIDKVHFFGESTSGMIGETLAARHGNRLLSLTTCSSPTSLPNAALQLFSFGHESWPTACRTLGSRGWGEALANIPGTMEDAGNLAYRKWWLDTIGISDGEGLAQYAEMLATIDTMPLLESIDVPMVILAPTKSAVVPMSHQKEVSGRVKGSRLVEVDGRGHEIYVDRAEECMGALLTFLGDCRRSS